MLLEKGADPNISDIYGFTPLGVACGTGGAKCIDLLISYGALINHQNNDG